MATEIVQLSGGPNNGVELAYQVPPALPAKINYIGAVYDNAHQTKRDSAGDTVHVFTYDKAASANTSLPAGHKGFNNFQHAFATTLPTKLARSKGTRRAALRKLGAPRKIQNL